MNFDEAIAAHAGWKHRLASYLAKADGSLKPEEVSPDNRCVLGKWIHGEGRVHADLPEFDELQREHAVFHRAAADVVRRANIGTDTRIEIQLNSQSDFGKASTKVIQLLMTLKGKTTGE